MAGRDRVDVWNAAQLLASRSDRGQEAAQRDKFFSQMEPVVPWQALIDLIEPHHPKANKKGGRGSLIECASILTRKVYAS